MGEDDERRARLMPRGMWLGAIRRVRIGEPSYGPSVFLREAKRLQAITEARARAEARRREEAEREAEPPPIEPPAPVDAVTAAFALLGIERGATKSEIKKAAWKLAWEHHPDRGGDEEKFKEAMNARELCEKS